MNILFFQIEDDAGHVNMFLPTWLDPVENILLQKMIGEKYTILDFGTRHEKCHTSLYDMI
jgi:hypothetical protein